MKNISRGGAIAITLQAVNSIGTYLSYYEKLKTCMCILHPPGPPFPFFFSSLCLFSFLSPHKYASGRLETSKRWFQLNYYAYIPRYRWEQQILLFLH